MVSGISSQTFYWKAVIGFHVLINPIIVYFLVFPKYKKYYVDASFFEGYLWTVLSFVGYLLVMGLIIWIPSAMYIAW